MSGTIVLGTASTFGVLAGSTVTNTGPTVINGNVGLSPGSSITGFPPGTATGTIHAADVIADQAQTDLTAAYIDAASRIPTGVAPADLGGLTFTPGVYSNATSIGITGTVTLDGQGDPNAVFIFQAGSTLITADGTGASVVLLTNGVTACNVFWQVGSSATLGTTSVFAGNILALTSITANSGAIINGRLLARNGAVTLDDNRVTPCNAVICFSGKSKIHAKNIITNEIYDVNASEIFPNLHKVYSIRSKQFIPIKFNIVTGPTTRYMLIKKDALGENLPSEDFYVTSGHKIFINDKVFKAGKIPQAHRVKVNPENVYSIVTDHCEPILINNLAVMAHGHDNWIEYSKNKGIIWHDNK